MTTAEVLVIMRGLGVMAGLGIAGANFYYVFKCGCGRGSWKRNYRIFVGFCGLYFALIYTVALLGANFYALRSGSLTIGGIVLMMFLNIADVIIDQRECH